MRHCGAAICVYGAHQTRYRFELASSVVSVSLAYYFRACFSGGREAIWDTPYRFLDKSANKLLTKIHCETKRNRNETTTFCHHSLEELGYCHPR